MSRVSKKRSHRAGISETRGYRGRAQWAKKESQIHRELSRYLNNKITAGGEGGAKAEYSKNFWNSVTWAMQLQDLRFFMWREREEKDEIILKDWYFSPNKQCYNKGGYFKAKRHNTCSVKIELVLLSATILLPWEYWKKISSLTFFSDPSANQ